MEFEWKEKGPGTNGVFSDTKGSFMQKIRIRISDLSSGGICLLADAILQLARKLEGEVLFELCDDTAQNIVLPVPAARAAPAAADFSSAFSLCSPPVRIPLKDLICITSDRHYVLFTCTDSVLRARLRFRDAADLVPPGHFLACGRGVLLNMNHIREVRRDEFLLSDGSVFPISRRKRHELVQAFRDYRSLHAAP